MEAQSWVNHYQENIRGRRTLVVLGIGSGYHVEALAQGSNSKILAVEKHDALRVSFCERFSSRIESKQIEVFGLDEQSLSQLIDQVKTPFTVLTFAPAAYLDLPEFRALYDVLCGRETSALLTGQFRLRGLQDFFVSSEINLKSPSESYRKLAKEQSLSTRWRNVFKMMGELIR